MPGMPVHPLAIYGAEDHTSASRAALASRRAAHTACIFGRVESVVATTRRETVSSASICRGGQSADLVFTSAEEAMVYRGKLAGMHSSFRSNLDANAVSIINEDKASIRVS